MRPGAGIGLQTAPSVADPLFVSGVQKKLKAKPPKVQKLLAFLTASCHKYMMAKRLLHNMDLQHSMVHLSAPSLMARVRCLLTMALLWPIVQVADLLMWKTIRCVPRPRGWSRASGRGSGLHSCTGCWNAAGTLHQLRGRRTRGGGASSSKQAAQHGTKPPLHKAGSHSVPIFIALATHKHQVHPSCVLCPVAGLVPTNSTETHLLWFCFLYT